MAGIYQRGAVWWITYQTGGRQVRRSLKVRDKNLAKIALGDLEKRLERERVGLVVETPGDAWEARLARARATTAASTQRRLLPILARLRAYVGSDLTARRVHEYVAERQREGAAVSTIRYEVALVRGLLPPPERAAVRLPRDRDVDAHDRRRRYLSAEEVRRLEAACDPEVLPMCRGYLRLGCRLAELPAIRWRDVGKDGVRIANLKTVRSARDSHRVVPLHGDLAADLEAARRAGRPAPWFWPHGEHVIRQRIAAAARCAGLGRVTPHTLRRTFASHLVQAGASIYVVSRLLGHSTVEQTARAYAYLSPESLAGAVALLRY